MSARCFTLILVLLVASISGCGATLTTADLPLAGLRYKRLRDEMASTARHSDLGWLELMYGRGSASALGHFEKATRRDPDDVRALLGRGLALNGQGRYLEELQAWLDLLHACRSRVDPECTSLQSLALTHLEPCIGTNGSRILPILEQMLTDTLDVRVRDHALELLVQLQQRRGNVEQMRRYTRQRGCPSSWSVSGPFFRNAHLDLSRPIPDAAQARIVATKNCSVALRHDGKWGGIFLMTTEVHLPRTTDTLLSIKTTAPWQLLLDGKVIWTHDSLDERPAERVFLAFNWRGGSHRVTLKIGADSVYTPVTVALASRPPASFGIPTGPVRSGSVHTPHPRSLGCDDGASLYREPVWYAPLARLLGAHQADHCGERDTSYNHLALGSSWAPRFFAPVLLRAAILERDSLVPRSFARNTIIPGLRRLLRWDAGLGRAQLVLAQALFDAGEDDEALRLYQEGARRWPAEHRWHVGLQQVFRERSFSNEEEAAVLKAMSLLPDNCEAIEDLLSIRKVRKNVVGVRDLALRSRGCDATSATYARQLSDAGIVDEAIGEYRRLIGLRSRADHLRRDLAHLMWTKGDNSGAREELGRILQGDPGSTEDRVRLADLMAIDGQRQEAVKMLQEAFERSPWRDEIRRALEGLTGRSVMQRHRTDGLRVISRFRQQNQRYTAPAVVVQDRSVSRFFANGSRISLTHNIIQVLSKEGMERWGEVKLPKGATVLTLHTVKQDGSLHEPEEILGRSTISLPDLEVGDFVEMEYLEQSPPPAAFTGVHGRRFYFGSFEEPLVTSEFEVVAPDGLKLSIDGRGGAPRPKRTVSDGVVSLRWRVTDIPRLVTEPGSVHPEEYIPSVRVAAGASWGRLRDFYLEQTVERFRATHLTRGLVREITRGLAHPRQRARAIYRWTLEQLEDSGPKIASAAETIARGAGSRYSVLTSLLRQAGVSAELWLVRRVTASKIQAVPSAKGFSHPVVRCSFADGPVFLHPSDASVPFGYLPPALRGAVALRLAPGKPLEHTPRELPHSKDKRDVKLKARIAPDGTASIAAVLRVQGRVAQRWRQMISRTDKSQLRKVFEQSYLSEHFPGATLIQLEIDNKTRIERPLKMTFSFRTPHMCRAERGGLACKVGLYPAYLRQTYVKLARRTYSLQLNFHTPTTIELTIIPPRGYSAVDSPRRLRLDEPFGTYVRTIQRKEDRLTIRTEFGMPFHRVNPARYPAFIRFADRVDRADSEETRFSRNLAPGA